MTERNYWCKCWGQFVERCCASCCRDDEHAHFNNGSES